MSEREKQKEREREKDEARRDGAFKVKLVFRTRGAFERERKRDREDPHTHSLLGEEERER